MKRYSWKLDPTNNDDTTVLQADEQGSKYGTFNSVLVYTFLIKNEM